MKNNRLFSLAALAVLAALFAGALLLSGCSEDKSSEAEKAQGVSKPAATFGGASSPSEAPAPQPTEPPMDLIKKAKQNPPPIPMVQQEETGKPQAIEPSVPPFQEGGKQAPETSGSKPPFIQ